MKLSGRDAVRFATRPDPGCLAVLIYGDDAVEVEEKRMRLCAALMGGSIDDLRLSRIDPADARRSPAALVDEIRSRSFFDGRRVALVDGAGDGVAPAAKAALEGATEEDGFLIVTAGALPAKSKLRKLFEASKRAVAMPCYGDPPDRGEIVDRLKTAGLAPDSDVATSALVDIAATLDRAALSDFVRRLSLYSANGSLSAEDVAACAPPIGDAELDELIGAVFERRADQISALASRSGTPTSISIGIARYLRMMHAVLGAAARGASRDQAVGALRPPVYGQRRSALVRRCGEFNLEDVERALSELLALDDALRGSGAAVGASLTERTLIRIALSRRAGR